MLRQISHVKTKTGPLPTINRHLLKTRRIQAHVRERATDRLVPTEGYLWGPMNTGPYAVPITRWIE